MLPRRKLVDIGAQTEGWDERKKHLSAPHLARNAHEAVTLRLVLADDELVRNAISVACLLTLA